MASYAAEIRDWLIAIGTVGAVIAALGLAWWSGKQAKKRRPTLSLAFDPDTGVVVEEVTFAASKVILGSGSAQPITREIGRTPAAYLRFEVTNAPGRDAADDVEVILARIEEPSFEGDTSTVEISFPSFKWTHLDTTRVVVPPGVTRTVDIAANYQDPPRDELRDILQLLVDPEPGSFRNRLKHGTYELVLTVAARNADAVDYRTRIVFNPGHGKDDPAAGLELLDPPYRI